MTIGIAAAGDAAGAAILNALARLEAVAQGAIGGFVSVATMGADGAVTRAEIQRGGAQALLAHPQPLTLMEAPLAVLMSSGPDRPEPLSQFTPARPGVGLVTGHRFPNARGRGGAPLGEQALDLLAGGAAPETAARTVADENPETDAGLIVLSKAGLLGAANTALVRRHVDLSEHRASGAWGAVAVFSNSIAPHAHIAPLAAHLVERYLAGPATHRQTVHVAAGLPVHASSGRSRILVSAGRAIELRIATAFHGDSSWSAGLGPDAEVVEAGRLLGHAGADPYLIVQRGRLVSVDGRSAAVLPYRSMRDMTVP